MKNTKQAASQAAAFHAAYLQMKPDTQAPPDPSGLNESRALWLTHALAMYLTKAGADSQVENAVADLLCAVRHYCDRAGLSYSHEERRAQRRYTEQVWGRFTPAIPCRDEADYTLVVAPDDVPPGDEISGEELHCITQRLEAGDQWAWCAVQVVATWTDPRTNRKFEGRDCMSGCSYAGEQDFMENSIYWQDMQDAAYQDLIKKIQSTPNP